MGSEMCIRDRCWVCLEIVELQLDDSLIVTTSGVTDASDEESNNRLFGLVKQFNGDYIEAMGVTGQTVDAIRYESVNAIGPTVDIGIITGASGDGMVQFFTGLAQTGTGTLAPSQNINTPVWTAPNGTQGAQPAAIGAVLRQEIQSEGVAKTTDVWAAKAS